MDNNPSTQTSQTRNQISDKVTASTRGTQTLADRTQTPLARFQTPVVRKVKTVNGTRRNALVTRKTPQIGHLRPEFRFQAPQSYYSHFGDESGLMMGTARAQPMMTSSFSSGHQHISGMMAGGMVNPYAASAHMLQVISAIVHALIRKSFLKEISDSIN